MMNDLAQKVPGMYSKCTTVDKAQWIQISTASCYSYTCTEPPGKEHSEIKPYNIHQKHFLPKQVMEVTHSPPKEYHKSFSKYKPQLCFPLAMQYLPCPSSCSRVVAPSTAYGSQGSTGAQPPLSHPWL